MASKNQKYFLIIILAIILLSLNYKTIDSFLTKTFEPQNNAIVQRIVDGDTIIVSNQSTRLLGINCPEKGEPYSKEAAEFLEKTILNKTVTIESTGTDLYGRTLAYVFLGTQNINLEIINKGFANAYFPQGKQKYYSEFQEAWQTCVLGNLNFCKNSEDKCANCIKLKNFDYKNEIIILENKCNFECNLADWTIKDEGRKKFTFPEFILEKEKTVEIIVSKKEEKNTKEKLFWIRNDYTWTDSGDTMFLRDSEGNLVLWKNY